MKYTYLLCLFILTSCSVQKGLAFKVSKVEEVEFFQEYSGEKFKMNDTTKKMFLRDLNNAIETDSIAYLKTYKIFIHYKNGKIDTLFTNGYVYRNKKGFITKENLIEKYIPEHDSSLSERTQGILKTFRKLRLFLKEEKYDEVISCFSNEIQWSLKEIRKNEPRFKQWCLAWTMEDEEYDKYVKEIKEKGGQNENRGSFVFEENEWKIDQK